MKKTVLGVVGLVFLLAGCMSAPVKEPVNLESILARYREEAVKLQEVQQLRREQGIEKLVVAESPSGDGYLVSAYLREASLPVVIDRILEKTKSHHIFDNVILKGRVTAKFDDIPVLQAINLLLCVDGCSARIQEGILVIEYALRDISGKSPEETSPEEPVQIEVPLTYLDVKTASELLEDLYSRDDKIAFGIRPDTNTVFLVGPGESVFRVVDLLRKTDRNPAHVILETLVVELDVDELRKLGMDITGTAFDQFEDITTAFGSKQSSAVTFTSVDDVDNPASLTGVIDLLASQDKAKIISRPYLSTLSGKKAVFESTRDRYVVVEEDISGTRTTSREPISSGVVLEITPTVLADGMIRVDMYVEDSHFIPTLENVAAEVDNNSARTTMLVTSGQTIVVAGLGKNRETGSDSGVPELKNIPLLNLFFGKQEKTSHRQEVVIYVTPRIWTPALRAPLPKVTNLLEEEGVSDSPVETE